jgi:hypothetical protein
VCNLILKDFKLVGVEFFNLRERHAGLCHVRALLQEGKYVEEVLLGGKALDFPHQVIFGNSNQGVD